MHKGVSVTWQSCSSSSASLNSGDDSAWSSEQNHSSERTPLLLLHTQRRPFATGNSTWIGTGIMEKVNNSRLAYWADRLAVESEPGLTNAQVFKYAILELEKYC